MSSSGSPTTALPHISIDTSIGAMLIGTFITLILYGVIVHQVYRYSRIYSSDKAGIKFAVYATFILETFHTTLSCHACYYYLVSNYLNPSVLLYPTRTLQIIPLVTGMIVVTAQGFFARRAYIFGRQYRILVCIAVCFLIGELGCCIATTIVEIQSGPFTSFVPKTWVIALASGLAVVADIILTTVLIIALRQSRSGIKSTDSLVDVLVLYTITTGLLTSLTMLAVFLVTAVGPADMGTYTAISIVASKLYANSLLAALNSRQSLKGRAEAHTVGTEIFGTEVGRQEHKLASAPVSLELRVNSGSNRFTATTVNTSRKAANGDQLGNQDTHVEGFKAPNTQRDLVHIC